MATIIIKNLPPEYQALAYKIDNDEDLHNQYNVSQYTTPADKMLSCWEYEKFAKELPNEVQKLYPLDSNPQAKASMIIGCAITQQKAGNFFDKILAYFSGY